MQTEYTFDVTNFAQIMREIFVYEMNQINSNVPRSDAFFQANRNIVPLRKKIERLYGKQFTSGKPTQKALPIWTIAMAYHEQIVIQHKRLEDVLKTGTKPLLKEAERYHKRFDPMTDERKCQAILDMVGPAGYSVIEMNYPSISPKTTTSPLPSVGTIVTGSNGKQYEVQAFGRKISEAKGLYFYIAYIPEDDHAYIHSEVQDIS